ncbi:hypothetical protein GEMRC1_009940 [Eukaryota sp. GEM-RC1]
MLQPPLKKSRSSDYSASVYDQPLLHEYSFNPIRLQQSLLMLIHSHFFSRILKSSTALNDNELRRSPRRFYKKLRSSFLKVGCRPAVKMFFEANTVPVDSKDLDLLTSFASLFGATIRSVRLYVDEYSVVEDILEFTCIITHLNAADSSFIHHLVDRSSSHFFPRLRVLEVTKKPYDDSFISLCKSLRLNTTVSEFNLNIISLSSLDTVSLADVFCLNNTLEKVSLASNSLLKDADCLTLFTAISSNSIIKIVDLSGLRIRNSSVISPLLTSSSLRIVDFPRNCRLDSTLINGLKNNSYLREVSILDTVFNINDIVNVLISNRFLKKLELNDCSAIPSTLVPNLGHLILIFESIYCGKLVANFDVCSNFITLSHGTIHYPNEIDDDDLASLLKFLKANVPIQRVE